MRSTPRPTCVPPPAEAVRHARDWLSPGCLRRSFARVGRADRPIDGKWADTNPGEFLWISFEADEFSSLSCLRSFQFDRVKIDRSFVQGHVHARAMPMNRPVALVRRADVPHLRLTTG